MRRILSCSLAACVLEGVAGAQETAEPLPAGEALKLETVGEAPLKAWYRLLPAGRANDQAPWQQLIWFKRKDRTARESFFAATNFAT